MSQPLNPDIKALLNFVQEQAEDQPVRRRVQIYRGLSDVLPDPECRKVLVAQANVLENADRRCREFVFRFQNPQPPESA